MNDQTTLALASKMAALVEKFERRCESSGAELQRLTQQVPSLLRQSADEQLRQLPATILSDVRNGIDRPVADYEQRLRTAGEQLHQASFALKAQLQRAETLHRWLIWKVAGVSLASLALLLGGGIWLSVQYRAEIAKNQISADLLRAYNAADVTLCDGRLCARLDKSEKPRGEYLRVKPR